ncbi:MAG: hypothetical protein WBE43_15640 [Candidatus Acidiferrales bacterium]
MKRVGIIGTTVLSLLFGATAFAYAPQDKQPEKQAKPQKQSQPAKQSAKPQRAQQQQTEKAKPQRAQQQPTEKATPQRAENQQTDRTQHAQLQRTQRQVNVQEHEQPADWHQRRAQNWSSQHRTWQQRGGYNGYRIPTAYFNSYYGENHAFRVYNLPFMEVGGFPRFQYGGYWFSMVDPYPEYWGTDWYQTDDVYVAYYDDGYYLYDSRYPGRPGIAINIML